MLLTILIPTYNRARFIDVCLRYYFNLLNTFDIEIIVLDNCSKDDTKIIVDKYRVLNQKIKYFCQLENVGYDRNVLTAISYASGKYIWIMGDTRVPKESYIKQILDICMDKPDAVLLAVDIEKRRYNKLDLLASDFGYRISLLCSYVVKSDVKEVIRDDIFNQYIGLDFIHVPILYEYLSLRHNKLDVRCLGGVYYDTIYIDNFKPRSWDKSIFKVFCVNWFKVIMSLPNTISINTKLKIIRGEQSNHMFNLTSLIKRIYRNGPICYKDFKENNMFLQFASYEEKYRIRMLFFLFPYCLQYLLHRIYMKYKEIKLNNG